MKLRDYSDTAGQSARKVNPPGLAAPPKTSPRSRQSGSSVVAQAVVVQRVDAVGEKPELPPVVEARAEGEVEEVLAVELDAEQRPELRPARRRMEEVRVVGGGAPGELAPAEERQRHADPSPEDLDAVTRLV